MIIQRRRLLVHDFVCVLYHVLVRLFLRFFGRDIVQKEVSHPARPDCSLVDCKTRGKFPLRPYLDSVQHHSGKVLAVVADQVVGRSLLSHVEDDHFA